MEEITRRTALTTLAAVPVVARVDVDSISDVEVDLLALAARDFTKAGDLGTDPKTLRSRWNIDPVKYPLLAEKDEACKILRSLEARGLVEMKDAYGMLPDGQEVNRYFIATERGRAALSAHLARLNQQPRPALQRR
jgi:hypothetical protein